MGPCTKSTPWCESWCGFLSAPVKRGGGEVYLLRRTCQSLLAARLTFPPKEREEREKESLIPSGRRKEGGEAGSNNSREKGDGALHNEGSGVTRGVAHTVVSDHSMECFCARSLTVSLPGMPGETTLFAYKGNRTPFIASTRVTCPVKILFLCDNYTPPTFTCDQYDHRVVMDDFLKMQITLETKI